MRLVITDEQLAATPATFIVHVLVLGADGKEREIAQETVSVAQPALAAAQLAATKAKLQGNKLVQLHRNIDRLGANLENP